MPPTHKYACPHVTHPHLSVHNQLKLIVLLLLNFASIYNEIE